MMRTKIFTLLVMTMLLASQAPLAFGQTASGNWARVQAVAVDDRLIVKLKDGKTIEGRMIEASDTNLSLTRDRKVVNVSRDTVNQIQLSSGKAEKTKWALIGTGVGAATGAGIGAARGSGVIDDGEVYIYIGTILGAGIGAVSGLAFGASRRDRELIYTAY
jgi:small nuclear ribonucleoprotein (snRNP)-like protein